MRRTYGEILEGCKYYKENNKGRWIKKGVAKTEVEKQLPLPFPENKPLRGEGDKDKK